MSKNEYYGYTIEVHDLANRYIERDVLANQSYLISEIFQKSPEGIAGTSFDNISNHYDNDGEPNEIYEWWLVTAWLADELERMGEPILHTDVDTYWGRTCTGQHIILDGTFQEIALKHLST